VVHLSRACSVVSSSPSLQSLHIGSMLGFNLACWSCSLLWPVRSLKRILVSSLDLWLCYFSRTILFLSFRSGLLFLGIWFGGVS
jgi:hypothetical protein